MALEAGDEDLYGPAPTAPLCRHQEGSLGLTKCDWTHVVVDGVHYYRCSCGVETLCSLQPAIQQEKAEAPVTEATSTTPVAVTPPETTPIVAETTPAAA